jgi:hypothetical protein
MGWLREDGRQGMTFTAADLGFGDGATGLFTPGIQLHPLPEKSLPGAAQPRAKLEIGTGIGAGNSRHRAGGAQGRLPG